MRNDDRMGQDRLFRIGPGFITYWLHIATHHNTLNQHELKAVRAFTSSLGALIGHRNAVERARRAFLSVSSLDKKVRPTAAEQEALFDATRDFYLTFYFALSNMASMVARFSDVWKNPPTRSNKRFLEWYEPTAMFKEEYPLLNRARQFRNVLDHAASAQPYDWATGIGADGFLEASLHGPNNRDGVAPDGSEQIPRELAFPLEHDWMFVAPDVDRVLCVLAVQLNMLVPLIQEKRFIPESALCTWENILGNGDPEGGYPILAYREGTIVEARDGLVLSAEDQAAVDAIYQRYADELLERDRQLFNNDDSPPPQRLGDT